MRLQALLLCAVLSLFVACAGDDAPRGAHDDSIALRGEALESASGAYFVGRQDMRRCRWPLCGGYWVKRVNRPHLRCPDGSIAAECYVAQLDTEALGGDTLTDFGSGKTIVRAAFATGDAGELGTYPLLRVSAAWRAATDVPPQGAFHLLQDNGIRCIRAPCFSGTADRLNTQLSRNYSGLDSTAVGASEAQLELALVAISEQRLIASGRFAATADGGVRFDATQLYLPVVAPRPSKRCTADADCTLSFYSPVSSAEDCYCPGCPVPQTTAVASANAAEWQMYCAETHGFDVCPPLPCPAPPPVACIAGECAYSFELEQ